MLAFTWSYQWEFLCFNHQIFVVCCNNVNSRFFFFQDEALQPGVIFVFPNCYMKTYVIVVRCYLFVSSLGQFKPKIWLMNWTPDPSFTENILVTSMHVHIDKETHFKKFFFLVFNMWLCLRSESVIFLFANQTQHLQVAWVHIYKIIYDHFIFVI